MGQVAGRDLIVLEKGLKTTFFKAYESHPVTYPKICTEIPSDSDQEKHGWLGSAPAMREWKDMRVPKGLIQHDYTIRNRTWENSIGVNIDDMNDDKYGQIKIRVADLGDRAADHPDELVSEVRVLGTSELCYDGQYYYDSDHVEGDSGTQSNIVTGSGVALSNLETDLAAAITAFRKFKDDRGKPFHPKNLQLQVTCPPDLEATFTKFLTAAIIDSTTNVYVKRADLVVDAFLTNTNDWYIDITNRYVKSFIFQMREKINFKRTAAQNSEVQGTDEFMSNHVYYGTKTRYNVGYGLWQNSIKVTNS